MRADFVIIAITVFLIVNTYHDYKYTNWFKVNKKMLKIGGIGAMGLFLYGMIKRNPSETHSLLQHANNLIRYMPIDKGSANLLSPVMEIMSNRETMSHHGMPLSGLANLGMLNPQTKRMLNSGHNARSRSVSESKKKFVASRQGWVCASCNQQLPGAYEVDHIVDLQYGGSNHVDNLRALCRNCHGEKSLQQHAY